MRVMFTNYKLFDYSIWRKIIKLSKKKMLLQLYLRFFTYRFFFFFYFIVIMRFGYIIQYQKPLAEIYLSDVAIFLSTAFAPLWFFLQYQAVSANFERNAYRILHSFVLFFYISTSLILSVLLSFCFSMNLHREDSLYRKTALSEARNTCCAMLGIHSADSRFVSARPWLIVPALFQLSYAPTAFSKGWYDTNNRAKMFIRKYFLPV